MRSARGVLGGVLVGLAIMQGVLGTNEASAHTNQCSTWAYMIGKEGRVSDSLHMHFLGCDDGPLANAHYEPNLYGEGCTRLARAIVRSAPAYYVYRPHTVAVLVKQARPWCTVYEDGSYEDNSTH